jgi:hypothetical protein
MVNCCEAGAAGGREGARWHGDTWARGANAGAQRLSGPEAASFRTAGGKLEVAICDFKGEAGLFSGCDVIASLPRVDARWRLHSLGV